MMQLEPIAYFHSQSKDKSDLPRQGVLGESNTGSIHFLPGKNFEQALQDLQGIERIWVLFWMHRARCWRPMVQPPRSVGKKGVFATRSPYRPNPLGLSCVQVVSISGLVLHVSDHDILDGSPIVDIKPYLPYADSFPDAKMGWIETARDIPYNEIVFAEKAKEQLQYLWEEGYISLQESIEKRLRSFEEPTSYNRVQEVQNGLYKQAYKAWRILFYRELEGKIVVLQMESGYSLPIHTEDPEELRVHQRFIERF